MNVDEYQRLVQEIEKMNREADRQEAALEAVLNELREKFGAKTVDAARKTLVLFQRRAERRAEKFTQALKEFNDEYGTELEQAND